MAVVCTEAAAIVRGKVQRVTCERKSRFVGINSATKGYQSHFPGCAESDADCDAKSGECLELQCERLTKRLVNDARIINQSTFKGQKVRKAIEKRERRSTVR